MLAPIDVVRFVALKMGVRQPDQLVLTPKDAELVGKQLRGKQVRSSHNERKWRIRGVAEKSARTSRFEDDEGNSITVAEYFFRQYNIVLRLPDLPCLRVGRDSDRRDGCRGVDAPDTLRWVCERLVVDGRRREMGA